ncbi:hypothetical protein BJX64DRAFT_289082 [Aspergillus heterothallicus]
MSESFPCLLTGPPGEDIGAILNAADLLSLKCSCTHNDDEGSQSIFGSRHIPILETDLSLKSLTKLVQAASDSQLAPLVQGLLIHRREGASYGEGFTWPRDALGQLVTPGEILTSLAGIISYFHNCSSFAVSRAPNCVFTGVDKKFPTPSEVVAILNTAIALSGVTVKKYGIDFQPFLQGSAMKGNPADGVLLDSIQLRDPEFVAALQGIESLTLKLRVESEDSVSFVLALLRHTPSLRELTIDFNAGTAARTFLTRLLVQRPTFQLKHLSLKNSTLSGRALYTLFAANCTNLQTLHLEQIHLEEKGSWLPIIELLRVGVSHLNEAGLLDLTSGSDAIDSWSLDVVGAANGPVGRKFVWDRSEKTPY